MSNVEAPVDKHGFTLRTEISDEECIRRCLENAPCGIDPKQVKRILEQLDESWELCYAGDVTSPQYALHWD